MNSIELVLIGIGLAMDAFAVAICKGLSMKRINFKKVAIVGLWFGIFQAFMPALGYFLGNTFKVFMDSISHFIAFCILTYIGVKMIKEAYCIDSSNNNDNLSLKVMFILALATSIDALTVGVTFAFFEVNLPIAVSIIGIITFILSTIGTIIGNKFGDKYEKKAQIMGGVILVILGIKNLLEQISII